MTAPTLVASTPSAWNSSTTPKTVTLTVQAGDVLTFSLTSENGIDPYDAPTATGVTWTVRSNAGDNANTRCITYTGSATTTGSLTVSCSRSSAGGNYWGFIVRQYRGSDGIGAFASSIGQASPSVSITTTQANSALDVISSDWNASTTTDATARQNAYLTVNGSKPTEDSYYGPDGTRYGLVAYRYADAGAVGAKTVGTSLSGKYTSAVIEIKGTAGAVTPHGTATGSVTFTGSATGHKNPHGSATGSLTFTGSATGHKTPHGAATGSLSFTGSATGHETPHGSATGSLAFTGSATGHAPVVGQNHGSATGTITFTGTATGHRVPHGASTGSLTLSGSASGHSDHHGSVSGSLAFSGAATGHAPVVGESHGTVTGSITFTGSAAGHKVQHGTATGSITFTGSATGHQTPHGQVSGSLTFTGSATGHAPVPGESHGTATGTLTFTGSASGHTDHHGAATGSLSFTATAHGSTMHHGSSSGTVTFTGSASGHQPGVAAVHGSATGSITFTGSASGHKVSRGAATGSVAFTGSGVGRTDHHGSATGTITFTGAAAGAFSQGFPDVTIIAAVMAGWTAAALTGWGAFVDLEEPINAKSPKEYLRVQLTLPDDISQTTMIGATVAVSVDGGAQQPATLQPGNIVYLPTGSATATPLARGYHEADIYVTTGDEKPVVTVGFQVV